RSGSIFSDFPAYVYPNQSKLIDAEGILLTHLLPKPLLTGTPTENYPCYQSAVKDEKAATAGFAFHDGELLWNDVPNIEATPEIKLFVPWKGGTRFSPMNVPCPVKCSLVDDLRVLQTAPQ